MHFDAKLCATQYMLCHLFMKIYVIKEAFKNFVKMKLKCIHNNGLDNIR